MLRLTVCLVILSVFAGAGEAATGASASEPGETQGSHGRPGGAAETPVVSRCTYTFIVPQQRLTGPVCLSTRGGAGGGEPAARGADPGELQAVRDELGGQRQRLEELRQRLEAEGGVAGEVRLLRKESRDMNTRVAQLYAQLLHEAVQRKDGALEAARLENKVLNVTAEVLRLAGRYRDLERRYTALTALTNNQSRTIAQLEQQCRPAAPQRQQHGQQGPSLVAAALSGVNGSTDRSKGPVSGNEILRDQIYSVAQDRLKRTEQPAPPTPVPMATSTKTPDHSYHGSNNATTSDLKTASSTPLPSSPHARSVESSIQPRHEAAHNHSPRPWQDCLQVLEDGHRSNGIYLVKPRNVNRLMQVWCDHQQDSGGWTVIQRRQDGSVNFFRTWENYKQGFGNIDGEYWLGLENMYWLSNQDNYKLLVLMEDWQGRQVFAEYNNFRVEAERDFYRLRLGHYRGNAGDSLSWHNGKQFTTLDRDRDLYTGNCAHYQKGGWWYYTCAHSNLNGVWYKGGYYRSKYQDGVYWAEFRGGAYSLKRVVMMIHPN